MRPTYARVTAFSLISVLSLAGCGGGSSSNGDDNDNGSPGDVSLNCDQPLNFPTNSEGVDEAATAEYEGVRYVALGADLCRIDPANEQVTRVATLDGVDGQLEPTLTLYNVDGGDEAVQSTVFPSGAELMRADGGTSPAAPTSVSTESEAGDIDIFRGSVDETSPESTPLTYRKVSNGSASWSATTLDSSDAPVVFADDAEPLGPVMDSTGSVSEWIVLKDGDLATVPVGDESNAEDYDTSDESVGFPYQYVTELDNGTSIVVGTDGGETQFIAYDPDSGEFSNIGSISAETGGLGDIFATNGEVVYLALSEDDIATLYEIDPGGDGSVDEIDSAGVAYDTFPAFVIPTETRVVWGWNPSQGGTDGSQVISMESDGTDRNVILDTGPSGEETGYVVASPVRGAAGDQVFFNEQDTSLDMDSTPEYNAYAVDASDSDADAEIHEQALWQGANAVSVSDKLRGATSNWPVSEVFLSQINDDRISELHVVEGNAPDEKIYLGDLKAVDTNVPPTSVAMTSFGLGPQRVMLVDEELIIVDTRHRDSMITLAVEDPQNRRITRFSGF